MAISRSSAWVERRAALGLGAEPAADDERLQLGQIAQAAEHQFGLQRIDAQIGCADRIDVDTARAESERRASGQQGRADHAATAADHGHVAVGALVRVVAARCQHGAQVGCRAEHAVARTGYRADGVDGDDACGIDARGRCAGPVCLR